MGKSNLPAITPQQAQDALNDHYNGVATAITPDQAIEVLMNAKPDELTDLTADYWKVDATNKGQTFHFIVTGFTMLNLEDNNGSKREVEAVTITEAKSKKDYVAAQTVLVGACKRLKSLPGYVQVTYEGKVGTGNSAYDKFTVKSL